MKLFEYIQHLGRFRVLVNSRDIADQAITNSKLADHSITLNKFAPECFKQGGGIELNFDTESQSSAEDIWEEEGMEDLWQDPVEPEPTPEPDPEPELIAGFRAKHYAGDDNNPEGYYLITPTNELVCIYNKNEDYSYPAITLDSANSRCLFRGVLTQEGYVSCKSEGVNDVSERDVEALASILGCTGGYTEATVDNSITEVVYSVELDAPKHSVLSNYVAIRDTSDSEEKYYLVDVSNTGNPALVYTERPSSGDPDDPEDAWLLPKVTKESTSWCKVKKDNTVALFELNSTVYYYRDGDDVEDLAYTLLETGNTDSTYLESAGSGEYTEYSIPIVEIQDVLSEFSKDYDLDNQDQSFYLPVEDIIKYREYYDIEVSVYGQAQNPDFEIYDNTKYGVLDTLYVEKTLPYTLTSEDIQRIVTAEAQQSPSEVYLGLSDNYQEGDTATLTFTKKS